MEKLMKFSSKKLGMKKFIIVLFALFGIAVTVLHSSYVNVGEMEVQLQQNLADVAGQNAVTLHTKVDADYKLIRSLSKELTDATTANIDGKLAYFKTFLDDYELKRFAFCFPDGTTYSTDGEVVSLAYRDFYKKGMEGKCFITGVLQDAISAEHSPVNVMTVPILNDSGDVTGVFGLAYSSEVFNESLQIDSFEGQGYSCAVNADGKIMAVMGDSKLELSHNIFSDMLNVDSDNKAAVDSLKAQMQEKKEGSGTLYLSEKNYYYCVPVDLMDGSVTWYILTIVPSAVLEQRVLPIQTNQYITSLLVGIFILIGAGLLILFSKEQQRKMNSFAYEDPMTKGPNFAKFSMDMECRHTREGYLVIMDITNFNNITIAAGKNAGETMIRETWKLISHSLCGEEMAAHVRDDIFLLFLSAPDGKRLLERLEQVSEQVSEKAKNLQVYGVHAEYGIYHVQGTETFEDAYSKVKIARGHVIDKPEQYYAFYDEFSRVKLQQEKQLEEHFPISLEKGEFEVWYQPKYSTEDGKVVGSEALVRWRKEDGEMISPGRFIPLFEKNGMIMKLDEYMFRSVCKQQKQWLDKNKKIYPVSVNISRASLYYADVLQRYSGIIREYNIDSKYIQLEVTETVMEGKADICELLNQFRQMGIEILMDDFGTGYSSLATLSTQCFDTLKLDKSLIDHIGDRDGETLLYHVIRMGQQIGLHITAEGVEQQRQVEFLQRLKCDDIQGFYFSKPMPAADFEAMLEQL